MTTVQQGSILVDPYAPEQLEVERRIEDIMSAARRRAIDELESYHAFGRKFTKFDDFEPLERQDADTTRRLEREAILGVDEFDPGSSTSKSMSSGRSLWPHSLWTTP